MIQGSVYETEVSVDAAILGDSKVERHGHETPEKMSPVSLSMESMMPVGGGLFSMNHPLLFWGRMLPIVGNHTRQC